MIAESAIIVEIWKGHAALQTASFIPPGSRITIDGGPGHLYAEVAACSRDGEYGFLTEVECSDLYAEASPSAVPPWCMSAPEVSDYPTHLPCGTTVN